MCGIVAIAAFEPREVGRLATAMNERLVHRGPDDSGLVSLPQSGVALAMRRLSILDLEGGHQPMWDEQERHCVIFNGEIYNFAELRRRLVELGHRFRTDHSDTEVLVHGYEQWGSDLFPLLNGMFALAIWDRERAELVVARDRAGEKPLYLAPIGRGYAVASELKALLAHPGISREIDPVALEQYLAFDFVIGPRTMLSAVQKLPAGHYAVISATGIDVRRYWSLRFQPQQAAVRRIVHTLDGLLEEAVRLRMVADVPVGLFLSGGLDSTTVGWYMRRQSDAVESFSIGFDDPEHDESRFARLAARHLHTRHHLEVFSQDRVRDLVPRIAEILDEPMGDQSIFPTYLLSSFTRRQVKVALGGDGSDELLMGYRTYQVLKMAWQLDRLPMPLRRGTAGLARRLPAVGGTWGRRARSLVTSLDASADHRLLARLGSFMGDARWVLSPELREGLPSSVFDEPDIELERALAGSVGSADRTIAAYIRGYLQEDILVKVDRASMAVSLEVRSPFLDPAIIDFLATVPAGVKLPGLNRKDLLRRLMRGRIPDAIIDRPKHGFGVPLNRWLRESLAPMVGEYLAPDRLRRAGILDPAAVARIVNDHLTGRMDRGLELWLLLQFELWRERWLEQPASKRLIA